MTRISLRLVSVWMALAVPGIAFAQDQWETPSGTAEPAPEAPPPSPTPPPTPPPTAPTPERHPERHPHGKRAGERKHLRPPGYSVGIGAGYVLPADLSEPDTVSARFRLASGLTFEPLVQISYAATSDSTDGPGIDVENTQNEFDFMVASQVRLPLVSRGRADLVGLGAATMAFGRGTNDPDGPDNSTDTGNLAFALLYGLSVEYFVFPHWVISFDATNPVFALARQTQEMNDVKATDSSFAIGAIWNPTVRLMLHLFY